MSLPPRQCSRAASFLIMFLVSLCVVAFALCASDPAVAHARRAADALPGDGPTRAEARQALIEMLAQIPPDHGNPAAHVIEAALDRLRHGKGLRIADSKNLREEEWSFNCNAKRKTFSFFTQGLRPTLNSFESTGRFDFNQGRWRACDFHWKWVSCYERAERSRRALARRDRLHRHALSGL
jgi:hypothetical protein